MIWAVESFVFIILCLITLPIRETRASFGDKCSPQNVTTCTQPQLNCTTVGVCGCSCGYIENNTGENGTVCRLPTFNEPCNTVVGCQESENCLNVSGSLRCQCYSADAYYYDPRLDQCSPKPQLTERCDVSIGCVVYSQCVATPPDPPTCQCNASNLFIDDINSRCLTTNYLAADFTGATSTATEVTFHWDGQSPESGIEYSIQWTPAGGQIDVLYPLGGQVSGLQPGTPYNFTIVSRLDGGWYHSEKIYYGPNVTVCTEVLYAGQCHVCGACEDDTASCMEADDGQFRCLCNISDFNSTQTGHCLPLEELKMANVSSVVTATTVTIAWSTESPSAFLKYIVTWTPGGGKLDYINSTWVRVTGLSSGTLYDFVITSVLPSDEYNPEKNVAILEIPLMTKPAFNESCNTTIGCQDYQHCLNQSGKMICQCDSSSEYYDFSKDQCLSRPTLDEPCDHTIGCVEFYQCVGTPSTCQCNSSTTYFDSFSYQCLQMRDLQVTITSITASTTNVSFTWEFEDDESAAEYDIIWTPHVGQLSYVDMEGGTISGLQPGTLYNFTIVADSSRNKYYGPNVTVCTKVLYAGDCSVCNVCQDNTTVCMQARDRKQRCLCGNAFYNKTQTGNCSSLEDLTVTDISSTSTTTTTNLTWTTTTYIESEYYQITWYPAGGSVHSVSRTGGSVSGLSPGVLYYFSIVSQLPADAFNDAKNVTSPDYLTKTQLSYLGDCSPYTNEDCQDMTACRHSIDGDYLCMCSNTSFFSETSGRCISLENLKVASISATFTATTATFSWTTSKQQPGSTNFTVEWTPNEGTVDRINSSGCDISGLNPYTAYNFTIVSLLPSDKYYPERWVSILFSGETLDTVVRSSNSNPQIAVGVGVGCVVLIIIAVIGVVIYKRRVADRIPTRLQEYFEDGRAVNDSSGNSYVPGQYSDIYPGDGEETVGGSDDTISLENLSLHINQLHNTEDQEHTSKGSIDNKDLNEVVLK